jgi:DNA-3-methyladenine glycosylase II
MRPEVIAHLEQDPALQRIIPQIHLDATAVDNNIYGMLLSSIVSQQLSTKVADVIYARFLDIFDGGEPHPSQLVETPVERLRSVGLSFQKSAYLRNVAQHWLDHQHHKTDWVNMSDDDILTDLTRIKGVGKWTVQMILMFSLDRPDIFPADDLGIRQAMVKLYDIQETGKPLVQKMHSIAERWRPYRTYASRYLWRWKDQG